MKSRKTSAQPKQESPPPPGPGPALSGRGRLLLVLLALGLAGVTWGLFEGVVWSRLPAELLGKWVVVEGPQEGATFEFFRDGGMVATVNVNGKEGVIKGRVEVDGPTLRSTTVNPYTKAAETDTLTIISLTETQLVVRDKKGTLLKMERCSPSDR